MTGQTQSTAEMVSELRSILGNQIFGAQFVRRDGTLRSGSFRLGVERDLTGAGQAYDTAARGNLIVWDMTKGAYRTIRLGSLVSISCHGVTINVDALDAHRSTFPQEA